MERKAIKLKESTKYMTVEEVCEYFKGLVYKCCQSWRYKYELDDLVQVGFVGLIKAYNTYSIERNILFTTYAYRLINNQLLMYNRREEKHANNISLYKSLNEEGIEIVDIVSDNKNYEDNALCNIEYDKLKFAIMKLDEREIKVIKDINFNHKSQISVGKELGLRQSSISRIYNTALLKLKKFIEC